LTFAKAAAAEFKIGLGGTYQFDKKLAEQETKAGSEKVKGTISAVDAAGQKFTLKPGKTKPDIEVATTEATVYLKGKTDSTFGEVIAVKAVVEVELMNGAAVKVKGK
jgi:hypothetical protein